MSDFSRIRKELSNREELERELLLKQLQINSLLTITQAINNNISADGLYSMYKSFLNWEMGIQKIALYIKQKDKWECAVHSGISEKLIQQDISLQLTKYERLSQIMPEEEKHPLIKEFDIVIPARHKQTPIAYIFIGGFSEGEDMYKKVQFITTITNVIAVAIENKRLFKRQIEQEVLNKEMELARDMQLMLVPPILPRGKSYELSSVYKPKLGVGGDYYDFIDFKDGEFAFCVGDISGKGIAAALLMANFQANFHGFIRKYQNLENFIKEINQSILRITQGDKFITFFVAIFNEEEKELRYINAGHTPPLLVTGGELHLLNKGCTILGTFNKLPMVETGRIKLHDDAIIMAFTDGLSDIKNEQGDYFEDNILRHFFLGHAHLTPKEMNKALIEQLEKFKGSLAYPDDFTLLTCKIFHNR